MTHTDPSPDRDEAARLVALAHDLRLDPRDLDENVHEEAAAHAAAVNSHGLTAQIAHLMDRLGAVATEQLIHDSASEDRTHPDIQRQHPAPPPHRPSAPGRRR